MREAIKIMFFDENVFSPFSLMEIVSGLIDHCCGRLLSSDVSLILSEPFLPFSCTVFSGRLESVLKMLSPGYIILKLLVGKQSEQKASNVKSAHCFHTRPRSY